MPPTAATQSPPDLAQLYLQMEQRNRSANEIDHGLDMIAASFSTPQMANAIMGSSRGQGQDPGAQLSNLIALQNMARLQQAPAPSGIDPTVWNLLPPDARAKVVSQAADSGIAIQQKDIEARHTDLIAGQNEAPGKLASLNDMDKFTNSIRSATENGTPVMQNILASTSKKALVQSIITADPTAMSSLMQSGGQFYTQLTPEEQAVAMNLRQLNGQVYGEAFSSTGSRRTQQEVANIKSGLSPLTNFNQSYGDYNKQLDTFSNTLHRSTANIYGGAGRLDDIPDNLKWDMSDPNNPKPLVDKAYLPGGDLYTGKGGQWASSPPQPTKQGGDGGASKTYTYNPKTGQLE